jgi:AcrR family transcriptional regulator
MVGNNTVLMVRETSDASETGDDVTAAAGVRERALAATERLVARDGFARVRLRDVAREAGVSIGSLQHHFDTRDALLRETFLWSARGRLERLAAVAPDDDPWARLSTLLTRAFAADDLRERAAVWIEYCAAAARDEHVRATLAELYDAWRSVLRATIQDGARAGAFRPALPVDEVVDLLAAQIDGLEVAAIVRPPGVDRDRLVALALATARLALGR